MRSSKSAFLKMQKLLLTNPGKLIQKIFRNFSFLDHESDRITEKLIVIQMVKKTHGQDN